MSPFCVELAMGIAAYFFWLPFGRGHFVEQVELTSEHFDLSANVAAAITQLRWVAMQTSIQASVLCASPFLLASSACAPDDTKKADTSAGYRNRIFTTLA